jgi:hypothetical protein
MTRCEMPPRGHVRGAAPGFGDHRARHQQPELDAHTGESDSLPRAFVLAATSWYRASSFLCMPRSSSTIVSVASAGLVKTRMRVAPESSAFATASVRIVSSRAPVYASRRSSRRCCRSTRVSPTWASYRDDETANQVNGSWQNSGAGSVRPTGTPERSGGWALATRLQAEEGCAACCMILSYELGGYSGWARSAAVSP